MLGYFVLGHYLFLKDHVFLKLCPLKTVHFLEQVMSMDKIISKHIFTPDGGHCLYYEYDTLLEKSSNMQPCVETANIETNNMTRSNMISVKISKENSWLFKYLNIFSLLFRLLFPTEASFKPKSGKI